MSSCAQCPVPPSTTQRRGWRRQRRRSQPCPALPPSPLAWPRSDRATPSRTSSPAPMQTSTTGEGAAPDGAAGRACSAKQPALTWGTVQVGRGGGQQQQPSEQVDRPDPDGVCEQAAAEEAASRRPATGRRTLRTPSRAGPPAPGTGPGCRTSRSPCWLTGRRTEAPRRRAARSSRSRGSDRKRHGRRTARTRTGPAGVLDLPQEQQRPERGACADRGDEQAEPLAAAEAFLGQDHL